MSILSEYNGSCFSIRHPNNSTLLINAYEGIPETLLLNIITWTILLFLFALLRNRAWDYGRLALVQNEKWTQLFYKNSDEAISAKETTVETSLNADSESSLWLLNIFKVNGQQVFSRCGPDAIHYLSFQKHLILLSAIITIISVCIVLPINFTKGNLQPGAHTFGHTTISNLEPNSKWIWIHVVASVFFVPITIIIMSRCSSQIPTPTSLSSRTVIVTHISRDHRNVEEIRNYFSVRYSNLIIQDIQIPCKVKHLINLETQRENAYQAKSVCSINNLFDLQVQPRGCFICCRCKTENALNYYTNEEKRLRGLVMEEKQNALQQPLGIAFVTFATKEAAQYVVNFFVPDTCFHWVITKAPAPADILWENLQISSRNWYLKAIVINSMLFIFLFFLTTPAIVVSILNTASFFQEDVIKKVSPVLSEFVPTLLLLGVSAVMPVIVAHSEEWMSHWTLSKQNYATMQKTFAFLLIMVLILPSFGMVSAQALLTWSVKPRDHSYRWECVFLPDKGAFFVNYIITSALIGTALQLLRFPELAMYVWRLLLSKSYAEKVNIQKTILSEFPFGIHYAWTLLIFTVSTVYSVICPLITPFGLLYLCLKHLVDKHNIYFVYKPTSMCGNGKKIHVNAVRNVRVGVILLQVVMLAFAFVRGGFGVKSIVTFFGLVGSLGSIFVMGPIPSCKSADSSVNDLSENSSRYIAPVLLKTDFPIDIPTNTAFPHNYGSSSTS